MKYFEKSVNEENLWELTPEGNILLEKGTIDRIKCMEKNGESF